MGTNVCRAIQKKMSIVQPLANDTVYVQEAADSCAMHVYDADTQGYMFAFFRTNDGQPQRISFHHVVRRHSMAAHYPMRIMRTDNNHTSRMSF